MGQKLKSRTRDAQATFPNFNSPDPAEMGHRIYTGSFSALESEWIRLVSSLQSEDPLREINVLVGSNVLALYLRRRLAESGRTAANIRFHNFLDLAGRLSARIPAGEKPLLPHLGPGVILENILAENTPPVYGALAGCRGFRDALLETFRDLRDAGFTSSDLDRVFGKLRNADRKEHLLGFSNLFRRYRERVSLFRDVDDEFRSAILAVSGKAGRSTEQLLIYGIYDVTGQQSLLLRAMGESRSLTYFIPFVRDSVSEFARPFVRSREAELKVQSIALDSGQPSSTLEKLAGRAFGLLGIGSPLEDDGSVVLVSAPGESRAAVEILREVFRAVHDGTIKGFHEAAVILRQPEIDIPIVSEMFRLRGVPFFIHGGRSFAALPLGRAVIALSRLDASAYAREPVLAAMELAASALPKQASKWDVQGWRALTNNPRFLGGIHSWESGTDGLVAELRAELERVEQQIINGDDEQSKPGARSAHVIRRRLESAMLLREAWLQIRRASEWPASGSWDEWQSHLQQRLEPLLGEAEDWQAFSAILDELGSLRALSELESDSGALPVARVRSALVEAVESRSCPVGNFQRSGVNLLSASAARGLRFPLVIIPGLDEGRFPAKLRQDPLLLDSERFAMGTLPLKSKRAEEEKLLFDMAARSAEKRLVLMTSRLDEGSDRERMPSQFFMRASSAVRGEAVTTRDLVQGTLAGFRSVSLDSPAPGNNEPAIDEGEIRLRMVASSRESANSALRGLAEMEPFRFSRPLRYDQARWVNSLTEFDGLISDPELVQWTARRIGVSAGQVSASRLEEYVKCPYFFFLKRAMDLHAWEEQGKIESMDPLDRGTAIHAVLEQFLRENLAADFALSSEQLRATLRRQAREILDIARPAGLADLLWEVERDGLLAMLDGWLSFEIGRVDDDLHVSRLEQTFGEFEDAKLPAFRVEAGRHTFLFRGRIDRVDVSRDGKRARVVDYKTGALPDTMAKPTRTPLMSGEKIQLLIYAGALSVLEEFSELETIEAEYLHLQPKNGRTLPCSFTGEELREGAQTLPEVLELVGNGIEKGLFFARSCGRVRPNGHCEFCDYLPVCGKDRVHREERKARDPRVRGFIETLEPL